jgi:hypothetical protein
MVFFCLLQCPVLVAWGEKDPWEPVELGRAYASFDTVEDFVVLPDVGHCPQVPFVTVGFRYLSQSAWQFQLCIRWLLFYLFLFVLQDEAPELVNPLVQSFVQRHS